MSIHNLERRVKGNVLYWGKKETEEDPYHYHTAQMGVGVHFVVGDSTREESKDQEMK
jgi:hypothetical protein